MVDFRKQSKKIIPNIFVLHLRFYIINIIPIDYLLQANIRGLGQNKRRLFPRKEKWEMYFTNMQFLHNVYVAMPTAMDCTEMLVLKAQSNRCKGNNEMLRNKDLCGSCERCPQILHLAMPISNKITWRTVVAIFAEPRPIRVRLYCASGSTVGWV